MSKQWEYQIQSVPRLDDIIFVLNKLGEEGWELIQLIGTTCILKREKSREASKIAKDEEQDERYGARAV